MDISLVLVLMALGLGTGFAAGLLGIGGGMIMVPLLTIIFAANGFSNEHIVHMAIATSLATILFTSMSSVRAHHKRGAIRWKIAFLLIPGVLMGSWAGPMIAARLNTRWLAGVFGVFVIISAINMLRPKKSHSGGTMPGPGSMTAAGFGIGTLSGLVGAGGGFITVPFLSWRGVPIHNAVATSAVMGFPIAMSGTLSYVYQGWQIGGLPLASMGYVYLPALACIATASILSAPLGAKAAHAMNVRQLRTVFACLLFVLASYMLWKAFAA